jgi:nicotinamide-nucleotide amidase
MSELAGIAAAVLASCRARGWRVGTAESCTGGLIAATLTEIAGSSDVVEGGFVTYANAAKTLLLGVPPDLLDSVGAVSPEVAAAMAEGALSRLPATHIAVSVTGIAGPGGATPGKPVGLVHFGLAVRGSATSTHRSVFPGTRREVRLATVRFALDLLLASAQPVEGIPTPRPAP